MKNTQYSFHEPLPVELRLQTYKEALQVLQSLKRTPGFYRGLDTPGVGICQLLPAIFFDMKDYHKDRLFINKEEFFRFTRTENMFPEVGMYFRRTGKLVVPGGKSGRIRLLKRWIKKLES